MAVSGVLAGAIARSLSGCRLIVDTGDAITALSRAMGRGAVGRGLTRVLETSGLRAADCIVVRGAFHRERLAADGFPVAQIPDGVETNLFFPRAVDDLRRRYHLGGRLVVGVLGTLNWSEQRQTCYGCELIEVIRLLRDEPVSGVIIGTGSGLPVLRAHCREYGVEDRVTFLGHLPYERLPHYLNLFDVGLSTQSNDLIGRVRTTGKLPLYLASGLYVLASDVGEASLVLPAEMRVPYEGFFDPTYPHKLAERVRRLLQNRGQLDRQAEQTRIARECFDYDVLSGRLADLILEHARRA
jgi:glycosyltransferase involved in cell wall biosynthesis